MKKHTIMIVGLAIIALVLSGSGLVASKAPGLEKEPVAGQRLS